MASVKQEMEVCVVFIKKYQQIMRIKSNFMLCLSNENIRYYSVLFYGLGQWLNNNIEEQQAESVAPSIPKIRWKLLDLSPLVRTAGIGVL